MKYKSSNQEPKGSDLKSEVFIRTKKNDQEFNKYKDELQLLITDDFSSKTKTTYYFLPKVIRLKNPRPGEPKYMKRRSRMVARLHKFNATKTLTSFITLSFNYTQCTQMKTS